MACGKSPYKIGFWVIVVLLIVTLFAVAITTEYKGDESPDLYKVSSKLFTRTLIITLSLFVGYTVGYKAFSTTA